MLSTSRDLVIPPLTGDVSAPVIFYAPLYEPSQRVEYQLQACNNTRKGQKGKTNARSMSQLYFQPLPCTLVEGEVISKKFLEKKYHPSTYKLSESTESALATLSSPQILHIATHGFFLDTPQYKEPEDNRGTPIFMEIIGIPKNIFAGEIFPNSEENADPFLRSGLALTNANLGLINAKMDDRNDGILTAMEVLGLDLQGTDLVVLSACETGVGEVQSGEGVYGLRRSFQEAGAKAVLSTLWSIDDEGTMVFMEKFYDNYLAGSSPQIALRQTKREFIQSKEWNNPYYWAPFVMVGR